MRLLWSPRSLRRVEEVVDRIAGDRPAAADRWLEGLLQLVLTLREFPERGRIVPELDRPDIRELQYRGYRILYRVREEEVGILTLKHGRRRIRRNEDPPGQVRERVAESERAATMLGTLRRG